MATNGLDTGTEVRATSAPPDGKSARPAGAAKAATEVPTRRRRARKEPAESSTVERFFLAEANSDGGIPMLGREMPNEAEAIIEAFRTGVNFFMLSEFRTLAETSAARYPVIKKEAVKSSNHSS